MADMDPGSDRLPSVEGFMAMFSPEGAQKLVADAMKEVEAVMLDEKATAQRVSSSPLYSGASPEVHVTPDGPVSCARLENTARLERIRQAANFLAQVFPGQDWGNLLFGYTMSAEDDSSSDQ